MGVDAKVVLVCVLGVVKFAAKTSFRFVKRYPISSGILSNIFLIYVFLPSVFIVLIYASPILLYGGFLLRKHSIGDKERGIERVVASDVKVRANGNAYVGNAPSVRENAKEKSKGMDEEAGKEKNDLIAVGREKKLTDKKSKGDVSSSDALASERKKERDGRKEVLQSASEPDFTFHNGSAEHSGKCDGGGELDAESSEGDEDEDEEEAREDGKKAVEWNEDDQKNLMDLGISELERNKRLESLIARRRSRKFQDVKNLIDMDSTIPTQLVPINISRHNPFLVPNDYDASSPIPGSAPSILLPARNPFDLPYDPQEEKPILTGDSFSQEFTAAHQKEFFFCRHESFTLGPSFPLDPMEEHVFARFRRQSGTGDHDQLVEKLLSLEDESATQMKGASDKASQAPNQRSARFVPTSRTINGSSQDSLPSVDDKTRFEENLFFSDKRPCHTPTYSIASDLQVEVSEIGSPPMTVDGTNSPHDGESLIDDGDCEKIIAGEEQMWGDSSHLTGVEENELRSREVPEVREEDIVDTGFSGARKMAEHVIEQDMNGKLYESSSTTEVPDLADSSDFGFIVNDKVNRAAENFGSPSTSNISDVLLSGGIEKAQNFREKLNSPLQQDVYPDKTEVTADHEVNELTSEDTHGGLQSNLSNPNSESNIDPLKHVAWNSGNRVKYQNTMESGNPAVESFTSNYAVDKPTDHVGPVDTPYPVEYRENLPSLEDNEQSAVESGFSGSVHHSDDAVASAIQTHLEVEEDSLDSIPSSSPTSVLEEKIRHDHFSPPSSAQMIHTEFTESGIESTENLSGERLVSLTTINRSDSTDQEPYTLQENVPDEANILNNLNEPVVADSIDEKLRPSEVSGGETETLIRHEVTVKLPESTEFEDLADLLKLGDENFDGNITIKKEEPTNESGKSTFKDIDGVSQSFTTPEASLYSGFIQDIDEKSENQIDKEATVGPSEIIGEKENQRIVEHSEQYGKPIEEGDMTHQSMPAESAGNIRNDQNELDSHQEAIADAYKKKEAIAEILSHVEIIDSESPEGDITELGKMLGTESNTSSENESNGEKSNAVLKNSFLGDNFAVEKLVLEPSVSTKPED